MRAVYRAAAAAGRRRVATLRALPSMILHLLRRSEFSDLAKLCSPSLFSVVSSSGVVRTVSALRASRAPEKHAPVRARHAALHARDGILLAAPGRGADERAALTGAPEKVGGVLLRLYFRQLFESEDALLDLRPSTFAGGEGGLVWMPSALTVRWEPTFLAGLRDTYVGFYGGDDARFRRGLAALDLLAAEDLFRAHFGADPSKVRFSSKDFTHTFGLVFESCAKARVTLAPDFLPFGFLLGALYTTLEQLDAALDVRAAFEAVARSAGPVTSRT